MPSQSFSQVIVVGGGLAGLSAAHTVLENGGRVLLLDKNPFLGGNSTKATSGINGAGTYVQRQNNIPDTAEKFLEDTSLSASKGKSKTPYPLARVLCYQSAPAVEWLIEKFGLDLSLIGHLGGHTFPRTHRGKEKFPGMTITYALMEKLEKISKATPEKAQFLIKAKVTKLLTDDQGVVGVNYEHNGSVHTAYGPVILATGGYGADFSETGLLAKYRPDIIKYGYATTNGSHNTGDGVKLAEMIGGELADMKYVQVHPTGLVDPREPESKTKWLAAEALRGAGGLLLNGAGERFCDELGRRDYVSELMTRENGPYYLLLNSAASAEIEWHCKHYQGRGLMKKIESGAALAKEIGVPTSKIEETFNKYNECAKAGKDPYNKKFFTNAPYKMDDSFYLAIVVPVVHYTMGGVGISVDSEVRNAKGGVIAGLFACGEVCGEVHGQNRLGGSSLLDCVVFGRVAGNTASKFLLSNNLKFASSATTASNIPTSTLRESSVLGSAGSSKIRIDIDPSQNNVSLNINWNQQGAPTVQSNQVSADVEQISSSPTESQEAAKKGELRVISAEEVAKHNKKDDCWVIVNGRVLDATSFLSEHPGGANAILLYAGKDATEEFNMLHEPDVIDKYAPYTVIGVLAKKESDEANKITNANESSVTNDFSKPNNTVSLSPLQMPVPSNQESRNSGGTADILPSERRKATFDVTTMTNVLDGGKEKTARRRFILKPAKNIDVNDKYNWSRQKVTSEHVKNFIAIHKVWAGKLQPTREDVVWMTEATTNSGSLMNHYGLFMPTLLSMASDQQKAWWVLKALNCEIIGVYAQTELGHGSNVRGLRTTAEYDKSTKQFIINTPTLQSMKWWPGTLGKIATHAVVYAQLLIDGKEYGVHPFFVQIRDENHRPLPGIELGDVGPKLGDHANDTGFARFDNLRIPREFLLSKYQQVTEDGQYVKSPHKKNDKVHYMTMLMTRCIMVRSAGGALAKAATIATRYSCVRKQGFVSSSNKSYKAEERQIIDYQVQRYRILKQLALTFALKTTGTWVTKRVSEMEGGSLEGVAESEALPELAATAAGLKGIATFLASQGIEDLRKCCGGNGYLLSSGIGQLSVDYVWQVTAEGDWAVMTLLTGRFLLKSLSRVQKGETLSGPVAYLNALKKSSSLEKHAPRSPTSEKDFHSPEYCLQWMNYRALVAVVHAGEDFQERIASGSSFEDAFNQCAKSLFDAVFIHCYLFLLQNFINFINEVTDAPCKKALTTLCALYGCTNLLEEQTFGLMDPRIHQLLRRATNQLLDEVRPNAVALVDSFDIPENVLASNIGDKDGNVYERLYESALRSEMNQTDPVDAYKHMKQHLDQKILKNGNNLMKSKM